MKERLVVYKTIAQRRAEYAVGTGLGIAVALGVRLVTPVAAPLLLVIILDVLLLVVVINTRRLALRGAPMLPSEEIDKRRWAEIAGRRAAFTIGEWVAGFMLLLAGVFVLVDGISAFDPDLLPIYLLFPIAGFLAGWRRVRMARAKMESEAPPAIDPYVLRFYGVLAVALASGVGISFLMPASWRLFAVLGGMLIGFSAMPAKRVRALQASRKKSGPDGDFVGAMGWGVVLWGVPMALFFVALIPIQVDDLLHRPPLKLVLMAGATVAIALAMGFVFGALMWVFGKAASGRKSSN